MGQYVSGLGYYVSKVISILSLKTLRYKLNVFARGTHMCIKSYPTPIDVGDSPQKNKRDTMC